MGTRGYDSEHWRSMCSRPSSSCPRQSVLAQIHVLPWCKFQNEDIFVFSSMSLSTCNLSPTWDLSPIKGAHYYTWYFSLLYRVSFTPKNFFVSNFQKRFFKKLMFFAQFFEPASTYVYANIRSRNLKREHSSKGLEDSLLVAFVTEIWIFTRSRNVTTLIYALTEHKETKVLLCQEKFVVSHTWVISCVAFTNVINFQ